MRHIQALKNQPLTPARVLELHRILMQDVLDDPAQAGVLAPDR